MTRTLKYFPQTSADYHNKMKTVISDPVHTKLKTEQTERRTNALIKKADIPEKDAKKLILHASAPPRFTRNMYR